MRRALLGLALAALLSCERAAPEPTAAPPQRPNVLIFTLDTLRADALPFYGNTVVRTPHLSALAGRATRFSRAYTVTPLTIPTHSSIFTGLYPPRHGVRDNGDAFLSDEATTLAELLRGAGYQTMASVGAEVTSHHWGFSQGFDAFYDDMGAGQDQQNRWRVERRGDAVVDDALGWLRQRAPGQAPFFAWIHLFDAHHPYRAPEPYAGTYPDHPYLAEVAYVDATVGRVLKWLHESGLDENTLVIAMADHGEGLGSHGEAMHGTLLYNATTRVPVIIRPPGGQAQANVVHFPVSAVDITPTVLAAAGVPAPAGLDGIDLGPWLGGLEPLPAEPPDRAIYLESLLAWRHYGWSALRAIVTRDQKLIDGTVDELYARDDVFDATDLAPSQPEAAAALERRVQALYDAMAPEIAAQAPQLDPERQAQLEALGYLTGGAAVTGTGFGEGLPDPVARLPLLRRGEELRGLLQSGDLEGARTAAEALLAEEPGLDQVRLQLATTLMRLGRAEDALAHLEILESQHPSSNARVAMAGVRIQMGDAADGVQLYRDALALDPYLGSAWGGLLRALYLSNDVEGLELELPRARAAVPELPTVATIDGLMRLRLGDLDGAQAQLEAALARDPFELLANHGLCMVAQRQGRMDVAETHCLEELRLAPTALPPRRTLVELYASQRRFEEQLRQLELIANAVPDEALTRHAMGQALFNLGRYDESLRALEGCMDLAPTHAQCMMLQANAYKKLGREAESQVAYRRALELAGQAK